VPGTPNTPAENPNGLKNMFWVFAVVGVVAAVILVVIVLTRGCS
jgi:hypothetical protein